MQNIGFRWYVRGWGVSNQVVCLILTMFIVKLFLKAIHLHKKRTIGFKAVQRWYILGRSVSKRVVCLILAMFMLKLYLKAIR